MLIRLHFSIDWCLRLKLNCEKNRLIGLPNGKKEAFFHADTSRIPLQSFDEVLEVSLLHFQQISTFALQFQKQCSCLKPK